jgi:hypothetical protein
MTHQSQCTAILKHLQTGRGITAMAALDRFGCFRLAARIYQLRQSGLRIEKHMVRVGKKQFASYLLDRA